MKYAVLLIMAGLLFVACVWFFAQCAGLFADNKYLAGILHMFIGFALVRAGVELSRLAVINRHRGVP